MLKKVILLTLFGKPHDKPWDENYFKNCQMLEKQGWYFKVFTPNTWKSEKNVEIIPMTIEQFNALCAKKIGLNPDVAIDLETQFPNKPMTDYMVAHGAIFEDYTKGFDFWGHTNWDMVYGRLDHFIPDTTLQDLDIFADDYHNINGIFTLYRNTPEINNLFKEIPGWENMFTDTALHTVDEVHMIQVVDSHPELRVKFCGENYMHSYDRLYQHLPSPALHFAPDGSLIEDQTGKEIMAFHFSRTKRYPNGLFK